MEMAIQSTPVFVFINKPNVLASTVYELNCVKYDDFIYIPITKQTQEENYCYCHYTFSIVPSINIGVAH